MMEMTTMRWLTAQELSKIARKSPDSDKPMSERTIRHMALQDRFKTKRDGKHWKIDPASALSAGLYIPPEILETLQLKNQAHVKASTPPPTTEERGTPSDAEATGKEQKRYKRLGDLGVYNELRTLYLTKISATEGPQKEPIKQTLYHLALGFYEFPKVNKAEYFKRARKHLVAAIVEDDLASANRSDWRDQLENSILPGIIGLILKQEGGKRGRGQPKANGKN